MISVKSLSKHFDNESIKVIDNITFSLVEGDSLAIIGPSGCGKTTLLYILAGLIRSYTGTVTIKGVELKSPSRKTAFILQDFGLLPWKTVWQNVCLGMQIQNVAKQEQNKKAEALLTDLGLFHHRTHYPARLSGGEKQRVAIARALALEPELLLMDEPFSSLDTFTRERLQDTLANIWQTKELTMILVTHNIEEAVFLGKRIMVLGPRPAVIQTIINNPEAGLLSYRHHDMFFETCKTIRTLIKDS